MRHYSSDVLLSVRLRNFGSDRLERSVVRQLSRTGSEADKEVPRVAIGTAGIWSTGVPSIWAGCLGKSAVYLLPIRRNAFSEREAPQLRRLLAQLVDAAEAEKRDFFPRLWRSWRRSGLWSVCLGTHWAFY